MVRILFNHVFTIFEVMGVIAENARVWGGYVILFLVFKLMMLLLFVMIFVVVMLVVIVVIFWC